MLIAVSGMLAGVLALVAILYFWSPGRPQPFLDGSGRPLPGSISQKLRVDINGVEQGMFIKARHPNTPVLLYLHGGMPDYFLTARHPTGLDDAFTVVWWDQRGSGLSYDPALPPESVTAEQLAADTVAVTNYLRTRFGQEKIYLMGHSGGSFTGIQVASRFPQLYHAYVGVAQMSNQLASETLAYSYMLQRFKGDRNARMVRRLEASPVDGTLPLPEAYQSVRDVAMHRLGIGTTHDMTSIVRGLLLPSLRFREYSLADKVALWRGKAFSGKRLWDAQLATDLTRTVTRLALPVYLLHGVHDYTVSYQLARSYYGQLEAPVKGFYTFHQSAHSPLFEEPAKTCMIMREDVLAGATRLADRE